MAINKTNDDAQSLGFDVNNGDLEALKNIVQKWNFKDEASALRFALAVLTRADGKVNVEEDGQSVPLVPGDSLLAGDTDNGDEEKADK